MLTPAIEFNTKRLAFRVWQDRHREPFVAMNTDPEVMQFFPASLSAEQSDAAIDRWRQQFAEQGWSNWAVELLATGEFLGFIGLSVPVRPLPCSPCVEIGWRLKRSAWGQGYASEGARECLRIGFERLGLDEIVSFTALMNLRSIAVMQRIGLRNKDRNFDHPALPDGHPLRPHCLFGLTRSEWNSRRSSLGWKAIDTDTPYDDDRELTRYVWTHYKSLFTAFEKRVDRAILGRLKAANPGLSAKMVQMLDKHWGATSDRDVNEALERGPDAFKRQVRERVLAEHGFDVFLNRCPRCRKIVETPLARQCLWCGFDWHRNTDDSRR